MSTMKDLQTELTRLKNAKTIAEEKQIPECKKKYRPKTAELAQFVQRLQMYIADTEQEIMQQDTKIKRLEERLEKLEKEEFKLQEFTLPESTIIKARGWRVEDYLNM